MHLVISTDRGFESYSKLVLPKAVLETCLHRDSHHDYSRLNLCFRSTFPTVLLYTLIVAATKLSFSSFFPALFPFIYGVAGSLITELGLPQ